MSKKWKRIFVVMKKIVANRRERMDSDGFGKPLAIYCPCGYVGEPKGVLRHGEDAEKALLQHTEVSLGHVSQDDKETMSYITTNTINDSKNEHDCVLEGKDFCCPRCKTFATDLLDEDMTRPQMFYDFVNYWDNDHLQSLAIGITEYYYNRKVKKIGSISKRFRYTFNAKTGRTYAIHNGQVRDITYLFTVPLKWVYPLTKLESNVSFDIYFPFREAFDQWLRACTDKRGVHYIKYPSRLENIFIFLRFPILQALPFQNYAYIPKQLRAPLSKVTTTKEIWDLFFGVTYKTFRKFVNSPRVAQLIHPFLGSVKDPNNLRKLLEHIKRGNARTQDFLKMFTPSEEKEYFYNAFHKDYSTFKSKAISFVRSLHHNENSFIRCFFKIKMIDDFDFFSDSEEESEKKFIFEHALNTCVDIYRMYQKIKHYNSEYEVVYEKDLEKLHDILQKDYSKIKHKNMMILYEEEEKQRFNREVQGYHFELAKDTHSLINIGNQMNICVGSYRERVLDRSSTIVIMYKDHEPYVCLEIHNQHLLQAKRDHNYLPNYEIACIIQEYCNQINISTNSTEDLKAVNRSNHLVSLEI